MRRSILLALGATACSPAITQEALLRDPHAITVSSEDARVLVEAGPDPVRVADSGLSSWLGDRTVVIVRDARGALSIGGTSVVDAEGRARLSWPPNHGPVLPAPDLRDGVLHLTVPYWIGRSVATRLSLATPLENVVYVREIREPSFFAPVVVFGFLLTGAGAAGVVVGATHSGFSTGTRVGEIAIGSLLLGPGLACLGLSLYGLVTPRTDRVVYRAAPSSF